MKFEELREKYPTFIFRDFEIEPSAEELKITYHFEIPGLKRFDSVIAIELSGEAVVTPVLKNLAFNLGMVELLSYVKCTCSPNIVVEAGYLDEGQIRFFEKLYYHGLGEFRYLNGIETRQEDLFRIVCRHDREDIPAEDFVGKGNLITVGGGKDSCVSLELLKDFRDDNTPLIINPKEVTVRCAEVAGYDKYIGVRRVLDKSLVELNGKGFLNGHVPFSAMVAFTSYICAYLYKKKYIVLSNEASANEATVRGTKINHQYSKTFEFEHDFDVYTERYFGLGIHYFSLLRPLAEFQIGMLFARFEQYHPVFRSCNAGMKSEPWEWCGNCSKCLFVFIMLSPFLYRERLVDIFGEDLFEKKELLETFIELLGYGKTKPFDCVGTYDEVRYAVGLTMSKLDKLPYLLQYCRDHYELDTEVDYETYFNDEHNVPEVYLATLRRALDGK